MRKRIEELGKTKSWFVKINKIDQSTARLTKNKIKGIQKTKI